MCKDEYIECQENILDFLKNKILDDELRSIRNMAYDFLKW